MRHLYLVTTFCCCAAWSAAVARGEIAVRADFENGSAEVLGIDQQSKTIRIRPAGDPRRGWPCWWSFQVMGVEPGETVYVEIDRTTGALPGGTGAGNESKLLSPTWSQPDRASYSTDGGRTWRHTEAGESRDGRKRYAVKTETPTTWIAWGPVFSHGDAEALLDQLVAEQDYVRKFTLSRTRERRVVSGVEIAAGTLPPAERYGLWIQARQHAWESGGSWVGVGLVRWLVSDDPRAVALREKSLITFVPVMDVDSVATGDGGKGQHPQDHNRDWSDEPHFPEVAAAQRKIKQLDADGRFDLFVDLHNPAPGDRRPFFFAAPDEVLSPPGKANLERFRTAAVEEIVGPLVLEPNLRRSGAAYSPKWREISKNWVSLNCRPHVVAVTLETSWNTPQSTMEGYQTVGRQLGLAIERYLRESPLSRAGER